MPCKPSYQQKTNGRSLLRSVVVVMDNTDHTTYSHSFTLQLVNKTESPIILWPLLLVVDAACHRRRRPVYMFDTDCNVKLIIYRQSKYSNVPFNCSIIYDFGQSSSVV